MQQYSYSKEDFLTPKPYEALYKLAADPFQHNVALKALTEYGKSVGYNGVGNTYKDYVKTLRIQQNTVYVDNTTMFTGQPLELNAGQWEADDFGIRKVSGNYGEIVACSHPIMPVECYDNIDTNEMHVKIAFKRNNQWRYAIVPRIKIADAASAIKLSEIGISVTSNTKNNFVEYMTEMLDLNEAIIPIKKSVTRLGYIAGHGFSPFVEDLMFDGYASFKNMFSSIIDHGSRDIWMETALECRKMSTTARMILAASFASVLLEPLGCLPFFVHLWGVDSGTGKTVALLLAASVWANPKLGKFAQTFDATEVGLEITAAFLNQLPLCLDELQLATDKRGNSKFDVYKLAQGVGRTRSNKSLGVNAAPTWCNCILTTGETPIIGAGAGAGAVNRVIEIECKASEAVITDGKRISALLKGNYGFLGREFVEQLYEDERIFDDIKESYDNYFDKLSSSDTTEKQAMAAAAILTADELVTQWYFHDGRALTVAEISEFLASKKAVSAGERAYTHICDWVARNGNRLCGTSDMQEVYGDIKKDETGMGYDYAYIIRSVFDQVMSEGGFSSKAILSYFKSNNLIETRGKNMTRGRRLNGRNVECICLKLPKIEPEIDDIDELPL